LHKSTVVLGIFPKFQDEMFIVDPTTIVATYTKSTLICRKDLFDAALKKETTKNLLTSRRGCSCYKWILFTSGV